MKVWVKHGAGILACSTLWGLFPIVMIVLLAWSTKLPKTVMLAVASIIRWPLFVTARSLVAPATFLSEWLSIPSVVSWGICSLAWGTLIWYAVVLIRRLSKRSSELRATDAAGSRSP